MLCLKKHNSKTGEKRHRALLYKKAAATAASLTLRATGGDLIELHMQASGLVIIGPCTRAKFEMIEINLA